MSVGSRGTVPYRMGNREMKLENHEKMPVCRLCTVRHHWQPRDGPRKCRENARVLVCTVPYRSGNREMELEDVENRRAQLVRGIRARATWRWGRGVLPESSSVCSPTAWATARWSSRITRKCPCVGCARFPAALATEKCCSRMPKYARVLAVHGSPPQWQPRDELEDVEKMPVCWRCTVPYRFCNR